jgi:hypothetical protein
MNQLGQKDITLSNVFFRKLLTQEYLDNVTDLIRALPGSGSVNSPTYTGGQQYSGGVF